MSRLDIFSIRDEDKNPIVVGLLGVLKERDVEIQKLKSDHVLTLYKTLSSRLGIQGISERYSKPQKGNILELLCQTQFTDIMETD